MTSSRIAGLMANFQKDENKNENPPPKSTVTPKWKQQQQSTSVEQAKPVEQPKTTPVVQKQPVQQQKPVEQPKQVVVEKKVEEKKPVEQPKQVVEQPKQNTTTPQKAVSEQPKPTTTTVQKEQPVQASSAKKSEEEEIDTVKLLALIERLEQRAQVLEKTNLTGGSQSASSSGSGDADSTPPAVAAFDEYHAQSVAPFLSTINKIGGDLLKVHDLIAQGFTLTRQLIEKASKSKKPANEEALVPHLTPIANIMSEIENVKNANRQSPFYNHLFALSEGMKCLAWVSVPNTPVAYVKEMVNSASFYSNKVLSEFRKTETGELHVSFVNQFKDVISNLADYVKEHHTTGLQFNPKGGDLSAASSSAPAASSVSTPKAKEQQQKPVAEQKPADKKVSIDVLSAINAKKDSAATGLKKVTDDMKSKNRTDKVSIVSEQAPKTASKGVNSKYSSGAPKFELEKGVGEKWAVEFQQGRQDLVISDTSLKQNVYIYRCFNSVVTIQGKVKGVIVNDCKRVGIVVDQVVSSIEFVNCESAKLQINGSAPTVSVDKTDGFQLYLTKSSVDTKLVSSKSSEMNVSVPSKTDEDDMVEHAIPEQYVTTYNEQTGKFDTVINSVFM